MPDFDGIEALPAVVAECATGAKMRGVRLRLAARTSRDWLKQWFDAAAATGFNVVVYDAMYAGQITHHSLVPEQSHYPKYAFRIGRRDLLAEACVLAGSHDMAIYAGMDTLYAGVKSRGIASHMPVYARHLYARTRTNQTTYTNGPERNSKFLCPVNRRVARCLCNYIHGLCESYPVDGLLMDFFRMPSGSTETGSSYCWCRSCETQAQEELGINLKDLLRNPDADLRERWNLWKSERLGRLYIEMMACAGSARRNLPVIMRIEKGCSGRTSCAGASTVSAWAKEGFFNYAAVVTHMESASVKDQTDVKPASSHMPSLLRLIRSEHLVESLRDETDYFELPSAGFLVEFADLPGAELLRTLRMAE
ncbi:MAG: hypothetical protein NTY46_14975 [Candidatus Sumerlaeota bacterium]|nr:hypothetical protein [Candidatus Sumerlaeota bacterium]